MTISKEQQLKKVEEARFASIARQLHDALAKSNRYGPHVKGIEKAGRMSHAIQFKHKTPPEVVREASGLIKSTLAKNDIAVSEHLRAGRFSKGVIVTPSVAERRVILNKVG